MTSCIGLPLKDYSLNFEVIGNTHETGERYCLVGMQNLVSAGRTFQKPGYPSPPHLRGCHVQRPTFYRLEGPLTSFLRERQWETLKNAMSREERQCGLQEPSGQVGQSAVRQSHSHRAFQTTFNLLF